MSHRNKSPRLSVSSWSLHRVLGCPEFFGVDGKPQPATSGLSLLDLPQQVRDFGIGTMEICHFHFPSLEASYLDELRAALDQAGIELWSILIDDGDITSTHNGERDLKWIESWIPVASALGAKNIRVIAGKAEPTREALERSRQAFEYLTARSADYNVGIMTENWFALLSHPKYVLQLLDELEGTVGLCVDFGNWSSETKYEDLAAIMPRAASCHTKAQFPDGKLNEEDFIRCLDLTREHNFTGPHTLIFDSPGDEWQGLAQEKAVVERYLS